MSEKSAVKAAERSGANRSVEDIFSQASEAALARLLVAGFESAQMPAALFGPDDDIVYTTEQYRTLVDLQPGTQTFSDMVRHWAASGKGMLVEGPVDDWLDYANSKRRASPFRKFEVDATDGRWFLQQEILLDGGYIWNFLTEITDYKSEQHKLQLARDSARRDADTDPLTGIYNRRYAISRLEREMHFSRINNRPLSIALIDLDHFKQVNDTYGHSTGDDVLSHFCVTASWILRRTDTFARFGGEEFLIIVPDASSDQLSAVTERIREQMQRDPIRTPALINYTMSAGVVTYGDETIDELLNRADTALYNAKHKGRNRTEIA